MKNLLRKPWFIFLGALLIVRLLPELGLQFYDEGTDSYYQVAIEGLFTAEPESLPAAWGKWTFISKIHKWLYTVAPAVNWYSIILLLLTGWCIQLFLSNVQLCINEGVSVKNKFLQIGLTTVLGLLLWENIFLIQFTRIAQFLCFFGLLVMTIGLLRGRLNWKIILNGTLAFIVGTMIRLEPGILAIGLLLPYIFANTVAGELKIKKLLPLLVLPSVTCFAISYLINNATTESDELTVLHNKFLHNTDGVKYGADELNIANSSDSLAYGITFTYFMNDPVHINQEFTERIDLQPFMSSKTLSDHITRIEKFKQRWNKNLMYMHEHKGLAILFSLISLAALLFPVKKSGRFRLATVVTILTFSGYYVIISGYMKMDHHVFIPLLFCFNVILVLHIGTSGRLKFIQSIILLLSVATIIHEFGYVKANLERKRIETDIIESYLTQAADLNKKHMVFDLRSIFRIYTKPFQKLPINDWSNSVSFDNGLIFVLPSYQQKLRSISGSEELVDNWNFYSEQNAETIFLAKGDRLREIVYYFNGQYGLEMCVAPYSENLIDVHSDKLEVKHDLGIYVVSTDVESKDQSISRNEGPGKRPL